MILARWHYLTSHFKRPYGRLPTIIVSTWAFGGMCKHMDIPLLTMGSNTLITPIMEVCCYTHFEYYNLSPGERRSTSSSCSLVNSFNDLVIFNRLFVALSELLEFQCTLEELDFQLLTL